MGCGEVGRASQDQHGQKGLLDGDDLIMLYGGKNIANKRCVCIQKQIDPETAPEMTVEYNVLLFFIGKRKTKMG